MKKYIKITALLSFAFVLTSCSTSRVGSPAKVRTGDDTIIQVSNPTSIESMLATAPGVFVDGFGPGARVTIRGGTPLFVLDGVRMGHSFASIYNVVDVNSISAIEVLTDPTETLQYGRDVRNGVIVIHTGVYELDENQ